MLKQYEVQLACTYFTGTLQVSLSFFAQTKKESAAKNGQEKQDVSEANPKRKEPLLLLALHVASHLDWNLGVLEAGLVLKIL